MAQALVCLASVHVRDAYNTAIPTLASSPEKNSAFKGTDGNADPGMVMERTTACLYGALLP